MFGKNKKNKQLESREERFKRVAGRRVQEILDKLRLLGNCSDRANYSYNEQQIKRIFFSINDELKRINALFKKHKFKKEKFSFD